MKKLLIFLFCSTACMASDPTPTPSPTELSQPRPQWLTPGSTNSDQAGANPATTFFISKNRVIVTKLGDSYLITFEP